MSLPLSERDAIAIPPVPIEGRDMGLPLSAVTALVIKVLHFQGALTGGRLADHICLPWTLTHIALRDLSEKNLCASSGLRGADVDGQELAEALTYELSELGRKRAADLCAINQYAGPAPVPLEVYVQAARHQANPGHDVTLEQLRRALGHLSIPDATLNTIGPAINARHTLFIYGSPGNGKTAIAEALVHLLGPPIFIPRALYVRGEIVRFFDPIHHTPVDDDDLPPYDRRWVLVERPAVKVGGELTPEQLDLTMDPTIGFYEASAQLKANGGLFLIDDFGRQKALSPTDCLNRFIVPLERRVDYLNLKRAGTSFEVPFTATLVLSTNMRPEDLVDEAFSRRLRFKIGVADPTEEQWRAIWVATASASGIPWDEAGFAYLKATYFDGLTPRRPLRGVHARDILGHITHAARFRGRAPRLERDLIDAACTTYFIGFD